MKDNTWIVYRHTFPNGKVYIGITVGEPEKRWRGGFGYAANGPMFRDIVKYGWDNISHEVLYSNLSEIDARKQERDLIEKFPDGRKATYNTQWAVKEDLYWQDCIISAETLRKYATQFSLLNDDWLAYYQEKIGQDIWYDLLNDGIIFHTAKKAEDNGNYFVFEDWFARYPHNNIRFKEVFEWLWTCPDCELVKSKRVECPKQFSTN